MKNNQERRASDSLTAGWPIPPAFAGRNWVKWCRYYVRISCYNNVLFL